MKIIENSSNMEHGYFELVVDWSRIVQEFDLEYNKVFVSTTAKAYLDFSDMTIDGAKERWKHILLLDTLACFFKNIDKSPQECERRRFDQYSVLRESVIKACGEALVRAQLSGQALGRQLLGSCRVDGLNGAWKAFQCLQDHLLADQTKKSWERRRHCVVSIHKHFADQSVELPQILQEIINRIYKKCFLMAQTPRLPSTMSFDEGVLSENPKLNLRAERMRLLVDVYNLSA